MLWRDVPRVPVSAEARVHEQGRLSFDPSAVYRLGERPAAPTARTVRDPHDHSVSVSELRKSGAE